MTHDPVAPDNGHGAGEGGPPAGGRCLPFCAPVNRPPDFEKIVIAVLATFAVFTGFTINKAVDAAGQHIAIPSDPGLWMRGSLPGFAYSVVTTVEFWALVALLSLLLRYLIGSAIHLNDTYVKRVGAPAPPPPPAAPPPLAAKFRRSESTFCLFKDLVFLVVFGIVVLSIAKAINPPAATNPLVPPGLALHPAFDYGAFTYGCRLFLLCGLVWSIVDLGCRLFIGKNLRDHAGNIRDYEWPGRCAYVLWPCLDTSQILFTWIVSSSPLPLLGKTAVLAVGYGGFLLADIYGMVRSLQSR